MIAESLPDVGAGMSVFAERRSSADLPHPSRETVRQVARTPPFGDYSRGVSEQSDGFFDRVRQVLFRHGAGSATPMASATRPGSPGLHAFHEQGPFDEPPAEPVEPDPEALPWELSDEPNGDAPAATS